MLIKLEWLGYRMVKKLRRYVKPFSSDTGTLRTDRQDLLYQYRTSVCWRAIKRNSSQQGRDWWLHQASTSIFVSCDLDLWPSDTKINCIMPVPYWTLMLMCTESVHLLSKYCVYKTEERTNGQAENIMPPLGTQAWHRHKKLSCIPTMFSANDYLPMQLMS